MLKKLLLCFWALFTFVVGVNYQSCLAKSPYNYCFIGDSRFVGMEQAIDTDENIIWVNRNGANVNFYWEQRGYISSLDRDTVIIYELGVNDLNSKGCIEALQDLEYLGFKHIYFTSVTPVDEAKEIEYGYRVQNSWIEEFNSVVRNNLPYSVASMDSYEYLTNMGFSTIDGVHYTNYTYQIWFDNIIKSL